MLPCVEGETAGDAAAIPAAIPAAIRAAVGAARAGLVEREAPAGVRGLLLAAVAP
jgi:hypothetical protein